MPSASEHRNWYFDRDGVHVVARDIIGVYVRKIVLVLSNTHDDAEVAEIQRVESRA